MLASVADVFGRHRVSIRSMEQNGMGSDARLVFITHECSEPRCADNTTGSARFERRAPVGSDDPSGRRHMKRVKAECAL